MTSTYQGRPCRTEEMKIGNTLFTVISVQSDAAKETAYEKVKKLILNDPGLRKDSYLKVHN